MNHATTFPAVRRAVAVLAVAAGTLAVAGPAAAAERTIGGGALDWGVKQSFRSYVEGAFAKGEISVADGAVRSADGSFRWPVTGGSYDADTATGEVRAVGTVRFTGHDGALEVIVRDPRIEFTPAGATLRADVQSRPSPMSGGGDLRDYPNVDLAALDLAGVSPVISGGGVRYEALPATLTGVGAPAFGDFYAAGTELDPVTVEAAYEQVSKPKFKVPSGTRKLGADRKARIARVRCVSGPCKLKAPKHTGLRIAGGRYRAKVSAPKRIGEGKTGAIAVKVPRAAVEALGSRTTKVRLKVKVEVAGERFAERIRASVKA